MWPNRIKPTQGFTLLEMLLAIAIFAVIGVASATVLQQVTKVNSVSEEAQQELRGLQQAMSMMERDFGQMVPRTSRGVNSDEGGALFEVGENRFGSDAEGMRFYRLGWLNPEGRLPRGSIQQVIYRIQEEKLQRLYTLYPDPVEGEEPLVLDLLEGVISLKFAFYLEDKWQTQEVDGSVFPRAVSVEIETEDYGIIQRRFLLAEGFGAQSGEEGGDDNGGSGNNSGESNTGSGSGNGGTTPGGASEGEEPGS
ncbi:type II secretion system minor pseudopilin GspJ [Ferrimonas balearica]|uniref:type II secretion system minor pseudopilin GspJ n=1 Tax=Ferrimonas balearica TaxID=44012 RepID=UPI001C99F52B|nr:type II secretion system minor pseudopilin GspJ [Ferrimonas balearica]MBY5994006.1 type II secretion system minor pseudopilin GspJ [Ferrimonas balearica]